MTDLRDAAKVAVDFTDAVQEFERLNRLHEGRTAPGPLERRANETATVLRAALAAPPAPLPPYTSKERHHVAALDRRARFLEGRGEATSQHAALSWDLAEAAAIRWALATLDAARQPAPGDAAALADKIERLIIEFGAHSDSRDRRLLSEAIAREATSVRRDDAAALAAALSAGYQHHGSNQDIADLPFVDDYEAFWLPLATKALAALPVHPPAPLPLDVDTLVVAILEAVKGVAIRHGIRPTEFLDAANAAANEVRSLATPEPTEENR